MKKLTMKTAESLRTYSCITCSVIVSQGPSINDVELYIMGNYFFMPSPCCSFILRSHQQLKKRTPFGFVRLEFLLKFEIRAYLYVFVNLVTPLLINFWAKTKLGGNSKFGNSLKTLWPSQNIWTVFTYMVFYLLWYLLG